MGQVELRKAARTLGFLQFLLHSTGSLQINEHFVLGGIINPPFLNPCGVYNQSFCPQPGIEFEFVHIISQMLNFTFEVMETTVRGNDTNVTGGLMEQLIEDLQEGKINMTMSFLTITLDEGNTLDFSQPIMYYRKGFLIRTPSSQKIEFLLTLPFGRYFWVCFLGMVPVFFVTLTVMSTIMQEPGKYSSVSHNAWTVFGSLVKPVIAHRYKVHTGNRCLLLTWQLGKTVFLSLYSASLVGFLFGHGDPSLPFRGLSDVIAAIESGEFRLVQVRGTESLANSAFNSSLRSRIEAALASNPPIELPSPEQAVKFVARRPGTLLSGFNTNLQIWARIYNVCQVTVVEDEEEELHLMAMAFHKSFAYSEHIKRITSEVANSNYFNKLRKKYVSSQDKVSCRKQEAALKGTTTSRLVPLSILQMQGTFWILAGGAVGGMAAILLEFIRAGRGMEFEEESTVEEESI